MNLTFPHIGVSDKHFLISMWFGLIAWNFCVCEAGNTLQKFKSKADILNPWMYSKLIGVSVVFLGFSYLRKIVGDKKADKNVKKNK
jgi:membrane protein DedA with SNARE-associated domain